MPFSFVLMEQSFFQTIDQCSSVRLLGHKNAVHPTLCPKGDLPVTPQPLGYLISANSSLSASDALQAFLYLACPHLSHWKNVPQSPSSCPLLQEPFSSCRRLHWMWAGSIPHSHGLSPVPVREDNLFHNSSQEVKLICNQLKWILPIKGF